MSNSSKCLFRHFFKHSLTDSFSFSTLVIKLPVKTQNDIRRWEPRTHAPTNFHFGSKIFKTQSQSSHGQVQNTGRRPAFRIQHRKRPFHGLQRQTDAKSQCCCTRFSCPIQFSPCRIRTYQVSNRIRTYQFSYRIRTYQVSYRIKTVQVSYHIKTVQVSYHIKTG